MSENIKRFLTLNNIFSIVKILNIEKTLIFIEKQSAVM